MTLNADRRKRGINTAQDLKANSERRPGSTCWWWLGAVVLQKGCIDSVSARIWTFNHRLGRKCTMSGPGAVYAITHGEPVPHGQKAYMRCVNPQCVNPAHVDCGTPKMIGVHIQKMGVRKGKITPAVLESARKGRAAQGIVDTPQEVKQAIRAAVGETGVSLADRYGLSANTVSRIRKAPVRQPEGLAGVAISSRTALERAWSSL